MNPTVSIVVPVYNEAENIAACLRRIYAAMRDLEHEILVCYDFDADTTLPAIAAMPDRPPTVRLVRNTIGKGAANALRAGFAAAQGDVVVTTMADLSDPPETIPAMAAAARTGADVVAGSRYMEGGAQLGGPVLKGLLSRTAGWLLYAVAGLGTRDATNNFRAYRKSFLDAVTIESKAGFEIALELTVKAHNLGYKVAEVPSTWTDRTAGESRFQLVKWLPNYLRWFFRAAATPAVVWSSLIACSLGGYFIAREPGPSEAISAFVAILLTLVTTGTILGARAIRGRLLLWDALQPAIWFLPFALDLLQYPVLTASILFSVIGSLVVLIISTGRQRFLAALRCALGRIDQNVVGFLLLTLLLWVARYRGAEATYLDPELDDSWRQVYGWVMKTGARVGRDIVFTHGPLAYFKESPFDPDLFFAKTFLWEGLLKLGLAAVTLLPLMFLRGSILRVAYVLAVFLPEAGPDGYAYSVIVAAVGWLLHRGGRISQTTVLVILGVALLTLVKFTYFVIAGIGIAVVMADCILHRQLSRALGIGLTALVSVCFGWLLAGQNLLDLPAYVIHSLWISTGYNHAMALIGPDEPIEFAGVVAWWLGSGIVVYLLFGLKDVRRWSSALLVIATAFLVFKAAFVRQQDTPVIFFTVIASLPLALLAAAPAAGTLGRVEMTLRTCFLVVLAAMGVHGVGLVHNLGKHAVADQWMRAGYRVQDRYFDLDSTFKIYARGTQELKDGRQKYLLPRLRSVVGDATIDVFGNQQGYALLNEMNYQPRPVFQSYSAYSRNLMELNAEFYASDRAPQFVLFTPSSLDNLPPNLHDSLALQEILRRYRSRTTERGMILFERDSEPRTLGERPIVFEKRGPFDQWIEFPPSEDVRVLELTASLNRAGKIQNALFKVPRPVLDIRLADGTAMRFGLDLEMAKVGFLLDPWVSYWSQLRDFTLNKPLQRVEAVRVTVFDEDDRQYYYNAVHVRLRKAPDLVPPTPTPRQALELAYPMFNPKPVAVETIYPPAQTSIDDQDVYLVHADSKIRFDLAPGKYSMRAAFGLLDSAWKANKTDGAEFRVQASNGEESRSLTSQFLDPLANEKDRGIQNTWLDFQLAPGEILELVVSPGPNDNGSADWAYWGAVVIAPRRG